MAWARRNAAQAGRRGAGPSRCRRRIRAPLHATTADGRHRYPATRQALDQHVRRLTRQRLTAADERIRHGRT